MQVVKELGHGIIAEFPLKRTPQNYLGPFHTFHHNVVQCVSHKVGHLNQWSPSKLVKSNGYSAKTDWSAPFRAQCKISNEPEHTNLVQTLTHDNLSQHVWKCPKVMLNLLPLHYKSIDKLSFYRTSDVRVNNQIVRSMGRKGGFHEGMKVPLKHSFAFTTKNYDELLVEKEIVHREEG